MQEEGAADVSRHPIGHYPNNLLDLSIDLMNTSDVALMKSFANVLQQDDCVFVPLQQVHQ